MKTYVVTLYGRQGSILAEIECRTMNEAERTYWKYIHTCNYIEIETLN